MLLAPQLAVSNNHVALYVDSSVVRGIAQYICVSMMPNRLRSEVRLGVLIMSPPFLLV